MARPFLRLVTGEDHEPPATEAAEARCAAEESSEQFSFSFDDAEAQVDHRVEIVATDDLHGKRLCELIMARKPKVALDLRYLMRFDLPGTSREQVLSCFRATNTFYTRDPIPWHDLRRRDFMAGDRMLSHKLVHETVEKKQSSVMLLVPKEEHAGLLTAYLNRVFSSRGDGLWEIAVTH